MESLKKVLSSGGRVTALCALSVYVAEKTL